jgi:hydroxyethylthiazole kinase-like sugar kinase family protein
MLLLRRNSGESRELIAYCEARISELRGTLSVQLLSERESDTLRGRIAELNKLVESVKNTGEGEHE